MVLDCYPRVSLAEERVSQLANCYSGRDQARLSIALITEGLAVVKILESC